MDNQCESMLISLISMLSAATLMVSTDHSGLWRNWALCNPLIMFTPEVLHIFHHLFWDHDLQWCLIVVGPNEIDYWFTLVQVAVGYCSFDEGVLKLKQVMGPDHHAVQRYIIGVIAGAVPLKFLMAISALLDFWYLTQMPCFDDNILNKIKALLDAFHENKSAIISAGGRQGSNGPLNHWQIPKIELLQHVIPFICASGAIMQWTADITEHAHVTKIKQPAQSRNNQDTTHRSHVILTAAISVFASTLPHKLHLLPNNREKRRVMTRKMGMNQTLKLFMLSITIPQLVQLSTF